MHSGVTSSPKASKTDTNPQGVYRHFHFDTKLPYTEATDSFILVFT